MKHKLITTYNGEYLLVIVDNEIIAHLPLKNNLIIEGVDLLPPITCSQEDGVEKLAKEKYGYTEEDLRRIKRILIYDDDKNDAEKIAEVLNVIQSLQQPKLPVGFRCEMGVVEYPANGYIMKQKTTINSQGQTEWVGEYIY